MKIKLHELIFLQNKLGEVPKNTPRRFEILTEEMILFEEKFSQIDGFYVTLDGINLPTDEVFQSTLENVSFLSYRLPRWVITFKELDSGHKILVPYEISCCKSKYRLDPRSANVRIYGVNGIINLKYYHSRCNGCKTKYYYNFYEDEFNVRHFSNIHDQNYFIIASGIGFTTEFLNHLSLEVTIGNVSFEHVAEIYNFKFNLFNSNAKLSKDIIEETWLIYRIVLECKSLKWDRKEENGRYFCETICLNEYTNFKSLIDSRWLKHICNEIGCNKRMVICDGNEKLYRYCCSVPIIKTKGDKGEINITYIPYKGKPTCT